MEKKAITVRSMLFIMTGVVVIVGMLMNWFPVELDLGVVQLSEVFGKINGFTMSKMVFELEEALGVLAAVLPEAFDSLRIWSVIITVCATVTVILYVCGIAVHVLKKERFAEIASLAAGVGAILTAVMFCKVIAGVYEAIGVVSAGYSVFSVLIKSPWIAVVLGGTVSVICTRMVADIIVECFESCAGTIYKLVASIVEWIKVIADNIGFLISDVIGAFAGLWAGRAIASMTSDVSIGVLAGLGTACLVAIVCCVIVCRVFGKETTK